MNDVLIQANDCLFQIKIGDFYKDFLCAKSFTVTVNTDEKEITTVGDGAYKDFDYKVLSYTANLNGAMRIPDGINPTMFDFLDYQQSFQEVQFRAVWVDPNGLVRAFVGTAIIKTSNFVANSSQIADGTVDLLGKGSFEIQDTIDDFINLNIICTGNNAIPAFVKFWLLDAQGNVIFQTDVQPQAVGSVLSNPFNLTFPVPPGQYYFYYYVDTNSVGNSINVNTPVAYNSAFNNGITQVNTYPNGSSYDFTADRTVTITLAINNPPPTCVPPTLNSQNIPDGVEGVYWYGSVVMSGLAPFTISNITRPSWMNVSLTSGNIITLQGAPQIGNNQTISFDVTNACGTYNFSATFSIADNPDLTSVTLNFTIAATGTAANCVLLIYRDAILIGQMNATGSQAFQAFPGSVVEIKIIGPALIALKELDAIQDGFGSIDSSSTTGTASVMFTILNSSTTYTVNGAVYDN